MDVKACAEWVDTSPLIFKFRSTPVQPHPCRSSRTSACGARKVQRAFTEMGVHDMAGFDIDALMRADEDRPRIWRAHAEMASRAIEVDDAIAAGAT